MALLRMKLDGEKYEIDLDRITLGEARRLKQDYGMTDFSELNFFDPDQMTGLFVIAVKRAHPELNDEAVLAKVEGLESGPIFDEINKQIEASIKKAKEAEAKADPPAAANVQTAVGGSETTPVKRGVPRSRKP